MSDTMTLKKRLRERFNYIRAKLFCALLNHLTGSGNSWNWQPGRCQRYFISHSGAENGVIWSVYACGLSSEHDFNCSWRGDLPGGPVRYFK